MRFHLFCRKITNYKDKISHGLNKLSTYLKNDSPLFFQSWHIPVISLFLRTESKQKLRADLNVHFTISTLSYRGYN